MRKEVQRAMGACFCGELVMGGFMVMLNTQGIEISEIRLIRLAVTPAKNISSFRAT